MTGCLERVQALWRLCCCCDGESKLKGLTPELEIETPDGKLAQMMLYHCPGQDAATSDSSVVEEGYYSTKYREKTLCLMTLANAMASTGFLPGNFDRAIWPGLLYTTILSEKATEEELKRNYEKEVEVLRANGYHSRWMVLRHCLCCCWQSHGRLHGCGSVAFHGSWSRALNAFPALCLFMFPQW